MRSCRLLWIALVLTGCRTAPEPAPEPVACAQSERIAELVDRSAGALPGSLKSIQWCQVDPCASPKATADLVDGIATLPALKAWTEGTAATEATRPQLTTAARIYHALCGPKQAEALTGALVKFPTVSAREKPADGPAFVAMAKYLDGWTQAQGFDFEATKDNGAWIVSAGKAAPEIAFVMHADVVPVDAEGQPPTEGLPEGWTHAPFEMSSDKDRLYGRGTEDDKGPIAAVLVTMHTLKKFGLLPKGQLQAIMGTGEESDWSGMQAFAKSRKQAESVISIDASFPVVVAESGFVAWTLHVPKVAPATGKDCVEALDVKAGQFLTQVPGDGHLKMRTTPGLAAKVTAAAQAAVSTLGDKRLGFELVEAGETVTLKVSGDAVHSSEADAGANALWLLAKTAGQLELCPSATKNTLQVVDTYLAGDHWGKRLNLGYEHPVMGKLLVIPTILRTEDEQIVLRINMRRPAGMSSEAFSEKLGVALKQIQATTPGLVQAKDGLYVGKPALVDPESRLVKTLMDIYRKAAADPTAKPKSIRGGTYARLFEGAVSFGPALPGHTYRGHAPDEYLERDALKLMLTTTLESVLRLSKK